MSVGDTHLFVALSCTWSRESIYGVFIHIADLEVMAAIIRSWVIFAVCQMKATGKLLFWCVEHFTGTKGESEAASALSWDDVRLCLQILNGEQFVECVDVAMVEDEGS